MEIGRLTGTGRPVAVKCIRASSSRSEDIVEVIRGSKSESYGEASIRPALCEGVGAGTYRTLRLFSSLKGSIAPAAVLAGILRGCGESLICLGESLALRSHIYA